jgi:hypothetical protein
MRFCFGNGINFYGLIAISLFVWLLEIIFLGENNKLFFAKILVGSLYLFFNFFLLNLIILIALSNVAEQFMNDLLGVFGLELTSIQLFSISSWPKPLALLTFFCGKRFLAVECTSLIAYCAFFMENS